MYCNISLLSPLLSTINKFIVIPMSPIALPINSGPIIFPVNHVIGQLKRITIDIKIVMSFLLNTFFVIEKLLMATLKGI